MQSKLFFSIIHLLSAIVGTCLAGPLPTCKSSYGNGVCTTQAGCNTGYTVKGDCPTSLAGNLCCIQATHGVTPEELVAYIGRVYDLAVKYPNKGSRTANQLVMEWGRHSDYADTGGFRGLEWRILAGDIDTGFTDYVNNAGIIMLHTLKDPFYPINTTISHTLAAMNVVYLEGSASGTDINKADVAGWGGDWWQFYGDWRNNMSIKESWANGANYCADNLATASSTTHFKLSDMVEDADAYNIGLALRNDHTLTIVNQLHDLLLDGGYKTRMARFYKGRFGGTKQSASADAKFVLGGIYPPSLEHVTLAAGRLAVILGIGGPFVQGPGDISDSDLQSFCDGFGNTIAGLVANEGKGIPS
ncbi:MAG: hypothetical protein M1839_005007 [Geoglossum umbratile]|nr:MAG: hypothetical protein M1839_005007 [Geoglossum umbratile]